MRISARDNNQEAEFKALTEELGGTSSIVNIIRDFIKKYPAAINAILGNKTAQASVYKDAGIREIVNKYKKQIRWILLFMAINGVKVGNAKQLDAILMSPQATQSQQVQAPEAAPTI
jgi:hypothetical protein